jgi:hypothetical protein
LRARAAARHTLLGTRARARAPQAAAVLAAVATAVVEAPLELFRHNAQAGTGAMGGDFFGAMWRVRLS